LLHTVFTQQCAHDLRKSAHVILTLVDPLQGKSGVPAVFDMAMTEGELQRGDSREFKIDWPLTDFARRILPFLDRLPKTH